VGSSATAYGYTLTVWSAVAVLSYAYAPPSPPEVLAFFAGAVAAFALVGVLAFGGEGGVRCRVQPRSAVGWLPLCFGRVGGGGRVVIVCAYAEATGMGIGSVRGHGCLPGRGRGRQHRGGCEHRLGPLACPRLQCA
jgi:hypothetical protein